MTGQTRIHLDEVEGLGRFIELEVVLRRDQTIEEGQRIAEALMVRLGVRSEDLVEEAYVDLLERYGLNAVNNHEDLIHRRCRP